nr:MAG TPA: hypothetical protein [Caudoviricetes sp.]
MISRIFSIPLPSPPLGRGNDQDALYCLHVYYPSNLTLTP